MKQKYPSRRTLLRSAGLGFTAAALTPVRAGAQSTQGSYPRRQPDPTYDAKAKGIRIYPGQWRPHYPYEQIAWVSPPWPSQDYMWLDFPEAIFLGKKLLFLSHIDDRFPAMYSNLPKVEWRHVPGGIAYERTLPNGVRFGGSVVKQSEMVVGLELHIANGSSEPLTDIMLQTCGFLRAIKEFADYTRNNKFVHLPKSGWVTLEDGLTKQYPDSGPYRVGWRMSGKPIADLPVLATVSNEAERLVAMTWHKDTMGLMGNPLFPCMHADPHFRNLKPGDRASVHGNIIFFEGPLRDFDYQKYASARG